MIRRVLSAMSAMGLVVAAPAWAEAASMKDTGLACAAPAQLPPPLQSWRNPVAAVAGTQVEHAVVLLPGRAADLTLSPMAKVQYPVSPEKGGETVSYGGLGSFTVAQAGTWRVALGSGAWVDVVKDGKPLATVGHGHGPACTGVHKVVDFDLAPGTYTLQLASSREPRITVLVAQMP